jgi:hypothetical protein
LDKPTVYDLADFTLKHYVQLLQYLKSKYKVVPFCEFSEKIDHCLILRHDIDYSLPAALKMAHIEKNLGIRSTYFVLVTKQLYDIRLDSNSNLLRQISNLGHEIGLHYFPAHYLSLKQNLRKSIDAEVLLLESLTGKKVHSIARHGPWVRDPFTTSRRFINANHPLFRADLFVHDSCRAWTPLEGLFLLLNDPPMKVQLLTHPENWQDEKISREKLLNQLLQSSQENQGLSKILKKYWLEDPVIREYDRAVKTGHFGESTLKSKSIFANRVEHYNTLMRWYLINTQFGWQIHKILEKISKII